MKNYRYTQNWEQLTKRPALETKNLVSTVRSILKDIKAKKDKAIKEYTLNFDKVIVEELRVTEEEIAAAIKQVPDKLKKAINEAKGNIEKFHKSQADAVKKIETSPGITCWRKSIGIDKVGLYIPAGTAPLFSTVLMLGVPAKIAGCKEIVLCSPPQKNGKINPVILYTASLVGCTQIFKIGGVQAIAAMAYGTETVPNVYKIFGPGNQYVTCAKQLVNQEGIGIDMPAGPSELLVWADEHATPAFVASDLLSQAEHGVDSQVVLVSDNEELINEVQKEITLQLEELSRKEIAKGALDNSFALLLKTEKEIIEFINQYAPEHLIMNIEHAEVFADQITNAGSVFLGNFTPESLGDYASGTNHTLPTNGFARSYSGVSVDSFVKKITFQKATALGLSKIGWVVEEMASAEELEAHKNAISIRLKSMEGDNAKA